MTVIRRAWGWLTGHVRLVIEYLLIAAVVSLGCAYLYGRIHSAQQDTRIGDLANSLSKAADTIQQQVDTNKNQDKAIAKLHELRDLDSKAIEGLNADLHKVAGKDDAIRSKLAQLEKHNAQAKALLDTPVPAAVSCVLDRTACAQGDDADGGADRQPK